MNLSLWIFKLEPLTSTRVTGKERKIKQINRMNESRFHIVDSIPANSFESIKINQILRIKMFKISKN